MVQRKSLIGFRTACERMWGLPGMSETIEALPSDVRERTAGIRPLPDWIPLDDLIAWHEAVWNGRAKRDQKVMFAHAHLTVDQGFGRVKRAVISLASAATLAPRVAALWNDEYSTGSLTATALEPRSTTLVLSDHPYVQHELMRVIIMEVFRYVLSLSRTKNVSATHLITGNRLLVALNWS